MTYLPNICNRPTYQIIVQLLQNNIGIINLSDTVLPKQQKGENTRPVDPNCLHFQTKKCNTLTYQKSYILERQGSGMYYQNAL